MTRPQSGILPDANRAATFVTMTLADGEDHRSVRSVAAALPAWTRSLAEEAPEAAISSVIGIGAEAWNRLFGTPRPAQLAPFRAIEGPGGKAPATPADLILHIRSERPDLNFELVRRAMDALDGQVRVVEEVKGFRYRDKRDLIGFVDGTENPTGDNRAEVALVGDNEPAFGGGSYLAIQRYVHDLASWEKLTVPEQEQIIARTKADDVEFESDKKPPTSHVKRSSIKEDGKSLEIQRHSMPYGDSHEHGLYFVAYARRADIFDKMLASMILGDGEGHHDHLLHYSRAVTGCAFFAPSLDWLESLES